MKKTAVFALAFIFGLGCRDLSHSGGLTLESLRALDNKFNFVIVTEGDEETPVRFLYADAREHIHLYKVVEGAAELEWESTTLGTRASSLFISDLDQDGESEIIIATAGGRILIYDTSNYELLWENLQDPFDGIECMVSANIDQDAQEELIFIADSILYIYDGASKTREWQSRREFEGRDMVLGNVDDDEQLEIVLNTGVVIDSRFYSVEFESEERFGDRISLIDINGDAVPEIIGENADFTVRVFDIYAERELW